MSLRSLVAGETIIINPFDRFGIRTPGTQLMLRSTLLTLLLLFPMTVLAQDKTEVKKPAPAEKKQPPARPEPTVANFAYTQSFNVYSDAGSGGVVGVSTGGAAGTVMVLSQQTIAPPEGATVRRAMSPADSVDRCDRVAVRPTSPDPLRFPSAADARPAVVARRRFWSNVPVVPLAKLAPCERKLYVDAYAP